MDSNDNTDTSSCASDISENELEDIALNLRGAGLRIQIKGGKIIKRRLVYENNLLEGADYTNLEAAAPTELPQDFQSTSLTSETTTAGVSLDTVPANPANSSSFQSNSDLEGREEDPFHNSDDEDPDYQPEVSRKRGKRDLRDAQQEPAAEENSTIAYQPMSKKKLMPKKEAQNLREKGLEYLGYSRTKNIVSRTERGPRTMGPACTASYCKKSKIIHCDAIEEYIRSDLFRQFWFDLSWKQRKSYICALVTRKPTKRPKSGTEESRRKKTYIYYLKVAGENIRVCKSMFLNTFGLGETMVLSWLKMSGHYGIETPPSKKMITGISPSYEPVKKFASEFIDMLPKLPSHYCRKDTKKMYLEYCFESKMALFTEYKRFCETQQKVPCCYTVFRTILKEKKVTLYSPKKDQCDICTGHKVKNVSDEFIEIHRREKNLAREEKARDKEEAVAGKCIVVTMDLQAVKLVPFLYASAHYYKTKLCAHNFTFFNLANADVSCYWFTEVDTDLTASTFVSCLEDYLKKKCLSPLKLPIIIYSDGCTYQNRNVLMSNFLSNFAMKHGITIMQKYLVKGHTQMECDSVHATIERKIKNKEIYLPSDYVRLTREARAKPGPYDTEQCLFSFFKDYTQNLPYSSIRPGKGKNDPTVMDLRQLTYFPDGKIYYKLSFADNEAILPQRRHPTKPGEPQARTSKCKISARKYEDLQELKKVLPADVHQFFDSLPH